MPQQSNRKPDPELARYQRQMLLRGFGQQGQQALLDSTAVLMGCGALGAAVAVTLPLGDILDGWAARRGQQVTRIGKLLDPLADKLMVSSALIMLIQLDIAASAVLP